jgi:5-methylthioribose kinase
VFQNDDMRRLHGEHIFHLPFAPNDFPLEEGVQARARRVQENARLVDIATASYERYLEPRGALLHADPQAGNVLLLEGWPKLLDPEIAHVGDPAFDVGTLLAHVWMPPLGNDAAASPRAIADRLWRAYVDAHAGIEPPTFAAAARYAGIEIMRRTIGAARVKAVEPIQVSLRAIDFAERLMLEPPARADQVEVP